MDINSRINQLLQYSIEKELIDENDFIYSANKLIGLLNLNEFTKECTNRQPLNEILKGIIDYAIQNNICGETTEECDIFDTAVMDCLMPRPSEVINKFCSLYKKNKTLATDYFYNLSKNSNYIRMDRINKNIVYKTATQYGDLDITINLSKPEKDPKVIAMAKSQPQSGYPKCALCYENVGYKGTLTKAPRQNHRVIPLTLDNEEWCLQYSPYVYYNEHCIVFKKSHSPMKITHETFARLVDFTEQFPHYFVGSNADLPIVGGSILTHDHFQGGNYTFAMAKAKALKQYNISGYEDVNVSLIDWPMDVLRLQSAEKSKLIGLASLILDKWREYSDNDINLIAYTENIHHNTITPIARTRNGKYELDLVLRNNRTNEKYPDGIFHPNKSLHHIKKENIGLIEVMGLAVLPARLKTELMTISEVLSGKLNISALDTETMKSHKPFTLMLLDKYGKLTEDEALKTVYYETGMVFRQVLECCGVFRYGDKIKSADRFIDSLQ